MVIKTFISIDRGYVALHNATMDDEEAIEKFGRMSFEAAKFSGQSLKIRELSNDSYFVFITYKIDKKHE